MATPTTPASATGVVPAGGGHGGVVVDVPPPAKIDTTSAGGGQPEPGRDVFAKEPEKQIESKPVPKDADVEKQISTVQGAQDAVVDAVEEKGSEEAAVEVDGQEAEIARNELFADS